MSHRFYISPIPTTSEVLLDGDQAHHALNVMRFKVEDELTLFDGKGGEADARIVTVAKKTVSLEIIERKFQERPHAAELTLAIALPKGDRQKFLIEKLVELGVARFIPLRSKRSVAVPNEKAIARINKQVIEASKQCERNWLMDVLPPMDLSQLEACINSEFAEGTMAYFGDPYEGELIAKVAGYQTGHLVVTIGPEGGFSAAEIEHMREAGFRSLKIGDTILRVETAGVAAAAILAAGRC